MSGKTGRKIRAIVAVALLLATAPVALGFLRGWPCLCRNACPPVHDPCQGYFLPRWRPWTCPVPREIEQPLLPEPPGLAKPGPKQSPPNGPLPPPRVSPSEPSRP